VRVLVTGATGFVGSYVVRRLLADGAGVRVLRRASSALDLLSDAASAVEHAVGDVTDPDAVRAAVDGCTHVVHAAASVAFGPAAGAAMRAVNVGGTAVVSDAAREAGVARLVHVSSIAALGRGAAGAATLDESTPWADGRANSRYAVSKRDAEREVWRAVAEGLDAVAVLPAVVFGVGRAGEGTERIVARVAGGRMRLAPPGATAVVDVRDVADGIVAALTRGASGDRFVLAGENLAWTDLLGTLARALGVPPPARSVPPALLAAAGVAADALARLGLPMDLSAETARTASARFAYDAARATRELGLTFRPFAETAAWIAASR